MPVSRAITDITRSIRCVTDTRLEAIATCFAISENLFMTAKHSLPAEGTIKISDVIDSSAPVGHRISFVDAELVWQSSNYDVAIIKPSATILPPDHIFRLPPMRPAAQPPMNLEVSTFGYPLPSRIGSNVISEFKLRAFRGHVISALDGVPLGVNVTTLHPLFDVSFPILYGLSGAPVFDSDMYVLGMCISSTEDFTIEQTRLHSDMGEPVQLFGYRFGVCLNLLDLSRFEPEISRYLP